MDELVNKYKALSDRNRIRILMLLLKGKLCVCEIQEILEVTTSTVSKHLSILKDAGFILDEKIGKWVYYRINTNTNDVTIKQLLLLIQLTLNNDETVSVDLSKTIKGCKI